MPIGLERTVTRAEGGWVREIDGRPAWDVFKEYLEGDPPDLQAEGVIHLCIGKPLDAEATRDYDAPHVIHTPLHLDKATGALFFPGGGLSTGERIRLTRRDAARIRESALGCARKLVRQDRRPLVVFQFDCAGRGRALFGSCAADEIVRPLQAALGTEVPWIGFHTYGEIAPIGDRSYYHNYTVVLCALYDAA
jgi:small ligand-binding sensory domain FIST